MGVSVTGQNLTKLMDCPFNLIDCLFNYSGQRLEREDRKILWKKACATTGN